VGLLRHLRLHRLLQRLPAGEEFQCADPDPHGIGVVDHRPGQQLHALLLDIRNPVARRRLDSGCLGLNAHASQPSHRRFSPARLALEDSIALWREAGERRGLTDALHLMGHVAFDRRDYATAQREAGNRQGVAEGLSGLAGLAAATGQLARAARLFAAAEALLDSIGAPLAPADRVESDRDRRATQAGLDAATLTITRAEGLAMTLEQAVAYALATETAGSAKTPTREPSSGATPLVGLAVPERYRLDAER